MMALYHVFTSATNLEKLSCAGKILVKKTCFSQGRRRYNELTTNFARCYSVDEFKILFKIQVRRK